ncbi:MAG TPA: uracil-DNA glycosylase [Gammaproteobacteria bacterium]
MSRRVRYLAEMGIPVYALRRAGGGAAGSPAAAIASDAASLTSDAVSVTLDATENALGAAAFASHAAAVPSDAAGASVGGALVDAPSAPRPATADAWRALEAEVRDCTRCPLHRGRTQTVFGVGRRDAELLVIGEAPGEEEDRQGEPFVGPAGRLLNAMLRAIGLSRQQVYIANILKCRPPGNRDPRPEEADACASFLDRQIEMISPRAMLAVGRISAQRLLRTEQPVGRLRGVVHRYGPAGIPLVVTYHPAYLLRTPIAKAKSWQDLCMLLPLLASSSG